MKKIAVILLACVLPSLGLASGGGGDNPHMAHAPINLKDKVGLQNGAKLFVSYCMGCHGLKFVRYERLAEDLDIPVDMVQSKLNFTTEKAGDLMANAMPEKEATKWFGSAPPDLTMVARRRGSDWLYSYLISFYEDDTRPYGVNNHIFPSVGMPHVMADMEEELGEEGFHEQMADLTNFLTYTAEPVRVKREGMYPWVLAFLFLLAIPAYLLKKEYWKDVH